MKLASPWLDTLPEGAIDRRGDLPAETTAVVIGAGITGVSAAYHLARRGMHTLLVERDHLAAGATGRNAGFLIAGTVEYFDAAVARWGVTEASAIWAFTIENITGIKNAVAREGIDCDLQVHGHTQLASTPEEWEHLQGTARQMLKHGLQTRVLSARGVEEELGLTGFFGGRVQDDDATLNPAKLV
ncbi:MAG: FAD-dependent oxidoreductase, partial [bacterium]